jgi:putative nucleotidyltransferase with HDIG domain
MRFSLIQQFSVLCLIALAIVGYAMGVTLSGSMEYMMHQSAIVESADIIQQNVLKHFHQSTLLEPKTGVEYDRFKRRLDHLSFGPNVVGIKVWNDKKEIVWFDDKRFVGKTDNGRQLRQALNNEIVSSSNKSSGNNHADQAGLTPSNVQEIYVPVMFEGQNKVKTVFEIYKDISALNMDIAMHKKVVWQRVAIGFMVLYGLLFGIVYSASRRINFQSRELEEMFLQTTTSMVNALDMKSPWTKGHSERTEIYAEKIAQKMGMEKERIRDLKLAGLLHDIGKIGTYDNLLDKDSDLTDEEQKIVRDHPSQGVKILEGIKQLNKLLPIIKHHHERYDGKGYPDGLKGEEIPLGARILHVADSYDAMTADRPYRKALDPEHAIQELLNHSGEQFDPGVTEIFIGILRSEEMANV